MCRWAEALCLFSIPCPKHLFHLALSVLHIFITNWWSSTENISVNSVSHASKLIELRRCCWNFCDQLVRSAGSRIVTSVWNVLVCVCLGGQSCRTVSVIWHSIQLYRVKILNPIVGNSAGVRELFGIVGGNHPPTHAHTHQNWSCE